MSQTTPIKPARQPRKKPARFCSLRKNPSGYGYDCLVLRQPRPRSADLTDYYAVEVFPSEMGGVGVELSKSDGTVYHVRLDGAATTCDCPGHESHGHCKHAESLLALQARGTTFEPPCPTCHGHGGPQAGDADSDGSCCRACGE